MGVKFSQPRANVGLRSSAFAVPPFAGALAGGFLPAGAPFAASASSSCGMIFSKLSHIPFLSQIELSKERSLSS